ncbi:MAG: hypothetical protein ACN6O7_02685 [Sphingobacterium sp.]
MDYRLEFAERYAQCEAVNFRSIGDPVVFIKTITYSLGADVCIDAVGCEAAGNAMNTLLGIYQRQARKYSHIKGWGIDFDPRNDPTFPIRNDNYLIDVFEGLISPKIIAPHLPEWVQPCSRQAIARLIRLSA